jgi:hypothetical protein
MGRNKGSYFSKGKDPRIAVTARFSPETFKEIEVVAEKEQRSMSQLVSIFCEHGLSCYKNGSFYIVKG